MPRARQELQELKDSDRAMEIAEKAEFDALELEQGEQLLIGEEKKLEADYAALQRKKTDRLSDYDAQWKFCREKILVILLRDTP